MLDPGERKRGETHGFPPRDEEEVFEEQQALRAGRHTETHRLGERDRFEPRRL
jgi:hypothetical protein